MKTWSMLVLLSLSASYTLAANDAPSNTAEKPATTAIKTAPASVASASASIRKPAPIVARKRVYTPPRPVASAKKKKQIARHTGKVRVLSATNLPSNVILPPLKNAPITTKPVGATSRTEPDKQAPAYVLTDPSLRWQFYSYP